MKKKLLSLLIAFVLVLTLQGVAALGEAETAETDIMSFFRTEASVEGKTVPVLIDVLDEEKPKEMEFTLYFVEGGDIPYVALPDFAPLLSELMLYGEETEDLYGLYTVNAEGGDIEYPEHYYTLSRTSPFSAMVLNTADDTIEFSDLNTFTQVPGHTALVTSLDVPEPKVFDMKSFYDEVEGLDEEEQTRRWEEASGKFDAEKAAAEKEQLIILRDPPMNIGGDPVLINLKDYMIDLVENNGVCYVPLQTLTDLFMGDMYLYVVYNTEKLFIFSYGSDMIDQVNAKEPEPMSEDFALFNYNELRLNLDLHYGLKEEHGITDFGIYFQKTGLLDDLKGTSGKKFDNAINILMSNYLDDLHSGLVAYSWRHEPETMGEEMSGFFDLGGPSFSDMILHSYRYADARKKAYEGPDIPMYEEIGDTAFITFDSFRMNKDDVAEYYSPDMVLDPAGFVIHKDEYDYLTNSESGEEPAEEAAEETTEAPAETPAPETSGETEEEKPAAQQDEYDTIQLFLYAFRQITRENSPIERVVIDLSNNTGGSVSAAAFVIGFIYGAVRIVLRDTLTGAQSVSIYNADCNLDSVFGSGDSMSSKGKKVYVLISPVSFSCGNLVPAACKAAYVTLVGQTSGGGSCVVLPACTASGTIFQISGNKQLSVIKNGSVYNIDKGIEPDIYLSTEAAYYDRPALVEYLHSLK